MSETVVGILDAIQYMYKTGDMKYMDTIYEYVCEVVGKGIVDKYTLSTGDVCQLDWYAYCYMNIEFWDGSDLKRSISYPSVFYNIADKLGFSIGSAGCIKRDLGDIEICDCGYLKLCQISDRVFLLERGKFEVNMSFPQALWGYQLSYSDYCYIMSIGCNRKELLAVRALYDKSAKTKRLVDEIFVRHIDLYNSEHEDEFAYYDIASKELVRSATFSKVFNNVDFTYRDGYLFICNHLIDVSGLGFTEVYEAKVCSEYDNRIIIISCGSGDDFIAFIVCLYLDFWKAYVNRVYDIRECNDSVIRRKFLMSL